MWGPFKLFAGAKALKRKMGNRLISPTISFHQALDQDEPTVALIPPQCHDTFRECTAPGIHRPPTEPLKDYLCDPAQYGDPVPPPLVVDSSDLPSKANNSDPLSRQTNQPLDAPSQAEQGKTGDDNHDSRQSVHDKVIRRRFIGKVYLIATCLLLIPVGCVCWFTSHEGTNNWALEHLWLYWLAVALCVTLSLAPVWLIDIVRRKCPPITFCSLGVYVVCTSYVAAVLACLNMRSIHDVPILLGITAIFVVVVSIFAWQTKIDFTACAAGLRPLLGALSFGSCILTIIIQVLVPLSDCSAEALTCVWCGLGLVMFTVWLTDDTQKILGGKSHVLTREEDIAGVSSVYVISAWLFMLITVISGSWRCEQ